MGEGIGSGQPSHCGFFAVPSNIEFVERRGPQRYAASVWERGAGLTQACGTGACAVAAAAVARGDARRDQEIAVELPGGVLTIRTITPTKLVIEDEESGVLRMERAQ